MNESLVEAEKSTAHTASMTPRGAPAMSTAGPKSFDMPRLPRALVITIGEQLTFEDRMMLAFTCKTLQGILHPSWMRSRLTGDQKQAVFERFEMHESDVYTYCPSCNKLHTNIKEHKQRHNPASPGRIEHEGCAAGSFMPNYTWERDSPVITYQDARMLINYRRYGRDAGMSPDEFYHGSGRNSVFSWANTLDVKYVGDKDLLLMKSFLWMEGPEYDPINPLQDVQPPSPSSEPSLDCHHLCRHVGLVNPSPTTLTLETFRFYKSLLLAVGPVADKGCTTCWTDWAIDYRERESDGKSIVAVTTYHLIGNVCSGADRVWGDFFNDWSLRRNNSPAVFRYSDYPYPVGTLPGLWNELEANEFKATASE